MPVEGTNPQPVGKYSESLNPSRIRYQWTNHLPNAAAYNLSASKPLIAIKKLHMGKY